MEISNETPSIVILNKKMTFFKNRGQEGKTVLSGGWYQWQGEGYKERV
jgi:hypothetical protein